METAAASMMAYASVTSLLFLGLVGLLFIWRFTIKGLWWATYHWAKTKQIISSVRYGWNAGEPPEGEWLLIREHAGNNWGVMIRQGDYLHTANGGYSMPIKGCTGWMRVTFPSKES